MRNFPIIATDTPHCKFCPKCGDWNPEDAETCESCGAPLGDAECDELATEDLCRSMTRAADAIGGLMFHKVTVESGYYCGIQFYVEELYEDAEDFTNEDSNHEFGLCRSAMLRKLKSERNRISRELRKAAADLCLDELIVVGRFSNGECLYSRVHGTPTVRQAAKSMMCGQ
jgi:ribosomal protein L40E